VFTAEQHRSSRFSMPHLEAINMLDHAHEIASLCWSPSCPRHHLEVVESIVGIHVWPPCQRFHARTLAGNPLSSLDRRIEIQKPRSSHLPKGYGVIWTAQIPSNPTAPNHYLPKPVLANNNMPHVSLWFKQGFKLEFKSVFN
jgi:hypothetical protein